MLSNLYYVPMWIFYRDTDSFDQVNELRNHRIAVGVEGSGTRSLVEPVFALNNLTAENTTMLPLGNHAALLALKSGEVDAAVFVDGAQNQAVWAALHDPHLKLMSYGHADAYPRLLPYIKKLMLPSGVIDVAHDDPEKEVALVGTKVMLAARDGLHPALIELLVDAAHEVHGGQGLFEEAGEFPGTTRVDLRISVMPTGTSVSGQASCIDTYRSGSRHWQSGLSSYWFHLLLFSFRSSTTCPSCSAGASDRGSIGGTVNWLY